MKTLLIFPPASDPAHPPLGIASLAGLLREKGEAVRLLDLNLLSYYALLSKENLIACAARIDHRLQKLEESVDLQAEAAEEYRLLVENSLFKNYLIENIELALTELKEAATYATRSTYLKAANIIRAGMEFVSAAYYPVRWYPRGFTMSYAPTKSGEVLQASADEQENIFIPFFESQLPQIAAIGADIIGISINYYCQLIPGLTLARILKRYLENFYLVVGGGLISFFQDRWESLRPFSGIVDGFIPFEGETPLDELITTLRRGGSSSEIEGLVSFRESEIHYVPPPPPPAVMALPGPSFEDLPLQDYLSPQVILPILCCRGCYWGRCAFCSHYQLYRGNFRQKPLNQLLAELETLAEKYQAGYFYFTDECLPPAAARRLAREIHHKRLYYQWFGEMRFESVLDRETLAEYQRGGCRMLMFGLESADQRVLDLMDKGITIQRASEIIQLCGEIGIRSFIMFFVGFPTETETEAKKTINFIESHREAIMHIAFSNFILEKSSPVYARPAQYGITTLQPDSGEDLKIYADYQVNGGLTGAEAIAFLEEIKERPLIRDLIDTNLLSRSHLIFLPLGEKRDKEGPRGVKRGEVANTSKPRLEDGLVAIRLPYNLDEIRGDRQGKAGTASRSRTFKKQETNYLFNPEKEKLIEVGEHGFVLLKPCNGSFSLGDILEALGDQNRETALNFYLKLEAAGFLFWEKD